MNLEDARRLIQWVGRASVEELGKLVAALTPADVITLQGWFELWAHQGQLPPTGDRWRVWLMMAGRGFGKTRAGAEWVHRIAASTPGIRIALVGASIGDARSVMVEGVSGLTAVAALRQRRISWEPSLGRVKWPNGSEAQIFSGDHADGLRGPEHDFAWCDELAKWREAEASWDNLQMGLRRGDRPRALVTTTPRPIALIKRIQGDPWTVVTGGRTKDNINLDEAFANVMQETYGGTRLGRQELDGELIADVEGALWPRELIERSRSAPSPQPLSLEGERGFDRIVVGVDPPAGAGEGSDACGIVVAGSRENSLHVLEDATVRGLSPEGWASRVAAAAARWNTCQVVAEANNGGMMVQSVLQAADLGLFVRLVHASKGKSARAEPIALKFETGKAYFAGEFPELEAELGGMIAGGGYEGPGRSPDRADAMVWAMTVLGETRSGVPRVRRL
jgi:phage terminase large subunit-like protein